MTDYSVAASASGTTISSFGVGVRSGTYPIRITRIEVYFQNQASASGFSAYTVSRYSGITLSGGSAVTPIIMRDGSPAASATARGGVGASASGTSAFVSEFAAANGGSQSYSFPFDFILTSGDGIFLSNPGGTSSSTLLFTGAIYFEELRLAWSH